MTPHGHMAMATESPSLLPRGVYFFTKMTEEKRRRTVRQQISHNS